VSIINPVVGRPTNTIDVESLSLANYDSRPVPYNWSDAYADEDWSFWQSDEAFAPSEDPDEEDEDIIAEINGEYAEGPVMNYYYPMGVWDFDPVQAAKELLYLPLCVVYIEETEQWGLALTGGGEDLSWEICEAFIRLGFAPPAHFCDLPRISGRGLDGYTPDKDEVIIRACKRTLRHVAMRSQDIHDRLDEMLRDE